MTVTAREQQRVRRTTWLGVAAGIAIVLLGLGLWAYVSTRPEMASVGRRDIVASVPLSGEVMAPPLARADVAAPYRAPVARVYASVGDRVRRGDTLVELSFPSAQAAYEQARQAVKAAETAYANERRHDLAPVEAARKRLAEARAAERAARGTAVTPAPATPPEAGTTGTPANTTAAPSSGTAGAPANPAPAGPNPGVTIREPAADLQQATANRVAAEQALRQAQEEMQGALAPYAQELEAARTRLQEAQSGRKMALVRAPIRGTILALNAQPGQEIGGDPKTPVATIVDLTALQVQAPMTQEQASSVRPGLPVTLTFDAVPGQSFTGQVSRITTRPAGPLRGQEYVATIDFKNEHGLVKPDMKASASVRTGEARDVLAVPSDAVDQDAAGRPVVSVLRSGTWRQEVVERGLSDGRYTEIRSGLRPGETVRVTPKLF
jgi:RND family efflux transporter MFP subunit